MFNYFLIIENGMFDGLRKKYFNMNDRVRKDIVKWCESWDDGKCQRCGSLFNDLEHQAQLKTEVTGIPRILPVYTNDHIDGDSSHVDGYVEIDESTNLPIPHGKVVLNAKRVWHKYGNMRRLCWSCNRIVGVITRKRKITAPATQEKQDRIANEGQFIHEVRTQLDERSHICYKEICKAGKNICDSSEITCQRYLDTEIRSSSNPNGDFHLFSYQCGGFACNGDHISWAGMKPDIILNEERKALEREWKTLYDIDVYANVPHEQAISQWSSEWQNLGKQWISCEKYVNDRLKFSW